MRLENDSQFKKLNAHFNLVINALSRARSNPQTNRPPVRHHNPYPIKAQRFDIRHEAHCREETHQRP